MSLKKEIKRLLDQMILFFDKEYDSLPKVPWDEDINPLLFKGEPDEEEYVCWAPVEKNTHEDFNYIEDLLGANLHNSLKEYFDCYYFLELVGFYNGKLITLEPVEPEKDIFTYFKNMQKYSIQNEGKFRYVDIGFISPEDLSIAVDNITGEIVILDYDTEKTEIIANSLEQLIREMKTYKFE